MMIKKITLSIALSLCSLTTLSAPAQGDLRDTENGLEVWHASVSGWISPNEFFSIEIKRLKGPTYGTVDDDYPPYENVKEWETLIDRLPDDQVCPMVFFHTRWRRLPDVLGLDERLRNYGGCKDVFQL